MRTPRIRLHRGLRGTAVAVAATALLSASQAPDVVRELTGTAASADSDPSAPATGPLPRVDSQGDDSYHTEIPPLQSPAAPDVTYPTQQITAESGIPATVLAAYRRAESAVARTDPGCRLPWQLLAAIGKVESGQARGGDVDAHGTTRHRITGPALNGDGFALIRDTEGGAWDGDPVYDRAVGPLQFLPGTWRRWGADGNGDGRSDPNNIYDAALGAGHYLCAGGRDLGTSGGLERAILSYNYSRDYLGLVLHWLEFYRDGVHSVPDGHGVIPVSPGAGGDTPAKKPVGHEGGDEGGGIVIGPAPSKSPGHPGTGPKPSDGPSPTPDPTDSGTPPTDPSTPPPTDPPTTEPPTEEPTDPGSPSDCPTDSASPTDSPTPTGSPTPDPTDPASPCPAPGA
ncbi:lytic transglycosylase domain-containing protein [Streptomyces sp. SID14478]|uniref:lytic transglycosylase domain-containing protein n=1 Tax=Streptomyces sp. SID14478 TaxID=2706073 RepID=UPI0013DAB9D1|nr:lytic transglycosylase domain-containing protein [Streptomyces sp. SID14478]NEB76223.1 lytic transglycosylase domain-containing protein [Streptomyces sp. SID14478]